MSPLPAPAPRPAPTDASGARTELRERIADAIRRYDWDTGISANPEIGKHQWGEAAAVLPVVEAALAAVEQRAEQAEAAVQRVRDLAEAAKRDTAQLFARQFGGAPFPATLRADDVLAALDQPEETR